jgi:hypothetical protein
MLLMATTMIRMMVMSQMMGRKSSSFLQLQCIGYYLSFAFIHVKWCGTLVDYYSRGFRI